MQNHYDNQWYPSPESLIHTMAEMVDWTDVKYILDPSAGRGDILEAIDKGVERDYGELGNRTYYSSYCSRQAIRHAIEIDPEMRSVLTGKNIQVVDSDFLSDLSTYYQYDLIIANPPFNEGDKHLLKAIDIMYSGQIVFILNAETLKNPYSYTRKLLVDKLEELNATITYKQEVFSNAERKTDVEIAIVYINIKKDIEKDLLSGAEDKVRDFDYSLKDDSEIVTANRIHALIDEYNDILNTGTETILAFYRNYNKIGKWIRIKTGEKEDRYTDISGNKKINTELVSVVNDFRRDVRHYYWSQVLLTKELSAKLTSAKAEELHHQLQKQSDLDFTLSNIKSVIANLIDSHEDTLNKAVVSMFDELTRKHTWHEDAPNKNVHYFNGWKTNKAFHINDKVIIPWGSEANWSSGLKLRYDASNKLNDLDKIMNFFAGYKDYLSISEAVKKAENTLHEMESTFFFIKLHRKGTIHLKFKDKDLLRKFNYVAAKDKNWLPFDYGQKKYKDCNEEEQEVIKSFEGIASYEKNANTHIYMQGKEILQLTD